MSIQLNMFNFRTSIKLIATTVLLVVAFSANAHSPTISKPNGELSVMVLGSGGPVATAKGRASAGYLIFLDGKPSILMDIGGGGFQRLAKSGVNVKDLDIILLSHLHIDHTGDLSSVLKTVYFHNVGAGVTRDAPFHIYGPVANGVPFPNSSVAQYPSSTEYLDAHYAMPGGVERYLNVFTKAIKAGTFAYKAHDLSSDWMTGTKTKVLTRGTGPDKLKITAIAVKHGPVPSVAYRIDYKGNSVVYSGDTNSESDNMIKLARGADLLIYDTAIMNSHPNPVMLELHTTPKRMGQVAAAANVGTLVLSHITPNTEGKFSEIADYIKMEGFMGDIETAADLKVYDLD